MLIFYHNSKTAISLTSFISFSSGPFPFILFISARVSLQSTTHFIQLPPGCLHFYSYVYLNFVPFWAFLPQLSYFRLPPLTSIIAKASYQVFPCLVLSFYNKIHATHYSQSDLFIFKLSHIPPLLSTLQSFPISLHRVTMMSCSN